MKNYELKQLPAAIAAAATDLNGIEVGIATVKQAVLERESEIDYEIVFDETLKNEAQRKSCRQRRLTKDADYQQLSDQLQRLLIDKTSVAVELERLRNEFSVAKLEARTAIALRLTGHDLRELVGV